MKKRTPFSSRAFRRGSLSLVFAVLIVAAVVVLNVLAGALSSRYPFSLDLTANKDYTVALSDEYESYVQQLQLDVEMIVCAPKADFNNGNFAAAMVQNLALTDYYNGVSDTTAKYARQAGMFLQSFATKSDRLSVTFADPNSVTEFAAVSNRFSDESLQYGDVIFACSHPAAGDKQAFERHQILSIADMFTTEDDQQYYMGGAPYYANITGSSLAASAVSALYIVTSDRSVEVALLGGHGSVAADGSEDPTAQLQKLLSRNNYTFTEVENLLRDPMPEQATMAVLYAPQTDYTAEELRALQDFLENDGAYGRTLVYLPSCLQPELPNLEEFLAEWGVEMLPAAGYDDTDGNYYSSPLFLFAQAAESDYTADMTEDQYFYPSNYRLARLAFETNNGYATTPILTTSENTYGFPLTGEVSDDWKPSDAEYKGQFTLAALSTYQKYDSAADVSGQSHLLLLSGDYFISGDVLSAASCYNSTLILNLFNGLSGQDTTAAPVTIEDKVIAADSFYEKILNTHTPTVMLVVFVFVIPATVVALSLVIWIRRKRR